MIRLDKPLELVISNDVLSCDLAFRHRGQDEHNTADRLFDELKETLSQEFGIELSEICPLPTNSVKP